MSIVGKRYSYVKSNREYLLVPKLQRGKAFLDAPASFEIIGAPTENNDN